MGMFLGYPEGLFYDRFGPMWTCLWGGFLLFSGYAGVYALTASMMHTIPYHTIPYHTILCQLIFNLAIPPPMALAFFFFTIGQGSHAYFSAM